jgi:hypothetical protein
MSPERFVKGESERTLGPYFPITGNELLGKLAADLICQATACCV